SRIVLGIGYNTGKLLALTFLLSLVGACAPLPAPTPTPVPTLDQAAFERKLAGAEAQLRLRASLPATLPGSAKIVDVRVANREPPTLDVEYRVGDQFLLLRQRPADSAP